MNPQNLKFQISKQSINSFIYIQSIHNYNKMSSKYSAIVPNATNIESFNNWPNATNIESFNNCEIVSENIYFKEQFNGNWNITYYDRFRTNEIS